MSLHVVRLVFKWNYRDCSTFTEELSLLWYCLPPEPTHCAAQLQRTTLNNWDGSLDCATAAGERMNSYFSPLFELCQFISEPEFKDGGTFWCGLSSQETAFKYLTCAAKFFDDWWQKLLWPVLVCSARSVLTCGRCAPACSWFRSGKTGLDHPGDITPHVCGRHECVWYNWIYLGEALCD